MIPLFVRTANGIKEALTDGLGRLHTLAHGADAAGASAPLRVDREANLLVSSLRAAWRDDFNGAELNPGSWNVISTGAGQSIALSGGELTINAGTTAGAETIIRSVGTVSIPCLAWFIGRMSQRIANQEFRLELVSADGLDTAGWLLDGTTAASGKYYASNGGVLGSTVSGVLTTAADVVFELEMFNDEFWASCRSVDSPAQRQNTYQRSRNIPDPNGEYHIQMRVTNLGTAPASNTQLILGAVAVQDINEITAEITGGRGDSSGGKAISVAVSGPVAVSHGQNHGTSNHHKLISAATTNPTAVKTSQATIGSLVATNLGATTRYLKIYNKTSAPTVGTDVPVLVFPIPAGQVLNIQSAIGLRLTTGLAYAITGGIADGDTTAIGYGEVVVNISYT